MPEAGQSDDFLKSRDRRWELRLDLKHVYVALSDSRRCGCQCCGSGETGLICHCGRPWTLVQFQRQGPRPERVTLVGYQALRYALAQSEGSITLALEQSTDCSCLQQWQPWFINW